MNLALFIYGGKMMRFVLLTTVMICLAGCAVSNQQLVQQQIESQFVTEKNAIDRALEVASQKCGSIEDYEVSGAANDRKKVVEIRNCTAKLYQSNILPYVRFPDLFIASQERAKVATQSYKNGEISFDELANRTKANFERYQQEINDRVLEKYGSVMQQAAQIDAAAAAQRAAAMSQMGSQMMKDTNQNTNMTCNRLGNTMNCNTW